MLPVDGQTAACVATSHKQLSKTLHPGAFIVSLLLHRSEANVSAASAVVDSCGTDDARQTSGSCMPDQGDVYHTPQAHDWNALLNVLPIAYVNCDVRLRLEGGRRPHPKLGHTVSVAL